jgi:acyl carrier protein
MTDTQEIERTVRAYILDAFLAEEDAETFRDDDDLLTLLDSLQLLRMVVALEGRYAFKVQDSDLSPDNLGSVQKVAAFVAHKCDANRSLADAVRCSVGAAEEGEG